MKNYEITEEQIREIETWGNYKDSQKVREEWFPEVFETKLEIGKWYKDLDNGKFLFCFQGGYGNSDTHGLNYGFNSQNEFRETLGVHKRDVYTPATDSEVLEALKKEAIKRGFVKGAYFKELWAKSNCKVNDIVYKHFTLDLRSNGKCLFHNGKWAEIIKTYTKEEAEKLLNAKII
jgi:hypothetical protein